VTISADAQPLCQCLLRMAPGCPGVPFPQTILFRDLIGPQRIIGEDPAASFGPGLKTYITPAVRQDYETQANLSGLLWKFTFFDNWNDGLGSFTSLTIPAALSY
jgi:hypothetical protein